MDQHETVSFFTPLHDGGALEWSAQFSERGLRSLMLGRKLAAAPRQQPKLSPRMAALRNKIIARIDGQNVNIPWKDFDLSGRAAFHLKIWRAMHAIPFGEVMTYGELAGEAGSPLAFRACGQACSNNPIILFIPCHRVIASTGLGGFNNRLDFKRMLLAWEGVNVDQMKSAKFKLQNV